MKKIIAVIITAAMLLGSTVMTGAAVTKADLLAEAAKCKAYKYVKVAIENAARSVEITDEQAALILPIVQRVVAALNASAPLSAPVNDYGLTAGQMQEALAGLGEVQDILNSTGGTDDNTQNGENGEGDTADGDGGEGGTDSGTAGEGSDGGFKLTEEEIDAILSGVKDISGILDYTYTVTPAPNATGAGDVILNVYNSDGKIVFTHNGKVVADTDGSAAETDNRCELYLVGACVLLALGTLAIGAVASNARKSDFAE